MNLTEIVSLSFQFHRIIYISLTQKCPIRCRHCFVESAPTREEHADLVSFRKWMDGILEAESAEIIMFSGGEPLSNPRALRYGLEACRRAGRYSILATSAFWATSRRSAENLLDLYPGFRCLWISTDLYHEEFVPLIHLRNAVEAATARDIYVVFQIVDDDPDHSDFMKRFERDVGFDLIGSDQVYVTPLGMVGRAAKELYVSIASKSQGLAGIPDSPCPWLGAPWLHEDGVLCACPNLGVHRSLAHPLRLGNLRDYGFGVLSASANEDSYLQALRVLGPRGIAESFPVEDWGWNKDTFTGATICDLCHSLASVPGLPGRVRAAITNEGLTSRIDALRVILYSETLHLLSRARIGRAVPRTDDASTT